MTVVPNNTAPIEHILNKMLHSNAMLHVARVYYSQSRGPSNNTYAIENYTLHC
jgi:hypothetical protein